MNPIKHFLDFLTSNTVGNTPQQPPVQQPQSATPPTAPSSKSDDGHIRRNKISFKQVGPNDTIAESEESWKRNGKVMEGDTIATKAITASGQVADATNLQSICTICNQMEDTVIRSDISHVPLCRICQRIFEKPDGEKIVVTPAEYQLLEKKFNTWEHFDAKKTGSEQ